MMLKAAGSDHLMDSNRLQELVDDIEIMEPPADDSSLPFERDADLLQLRGMSVAAPTQPSQQSFNDAFESGLTEYLRGDWKSARRWLDIANETCVQLSVDTVLSPLYRSPSVPAMIDEKVVTVRKLLARRAEMEMALPPSVRRMSMKQAQQPQPRRLVYNEEELTILGDGPSNTLLRYMSARNYTPPEDWKGFRPLTSK